VKSFGTNLFSSISLFFSSPFLDPDSFRRFNIMLYVGFAAAGLHDMIHATQLSAPFKVRRPIRNRCVAVAVAAVVCSTSVKGIINTEPHDQQRVMQIVSVM
jgi:hypothetical protein